MSELPTEPPERAADPRRPASSLRNDLGPLSNALLYLAFCLLGATGLAMTFRLDEPGQVMLGLGKTDWARVHAITALAVLSLVLLHLWVNGRWICAMLARLRWRTVAVALVGLTMLAMALVSPVR